MANSVSNPDALVLSWATRFTIMEREISIFGKRNKQRKVGAFRCLCPLYARIITDVLHRHWHFTWWEGNTFTYVGTKCEYNDIYLHSRFFFFFFFFFFNQSRYCDVTTTTALRDIKKPKCFDTHTDTVETLFVYRLFQHVVSGWKATENEIILPSQDRLQQWTPWPWVAEILWNI